MWVVHVAFCCDSIKMEFHFGLEKLKLSRNSVFSSLLIVTAVMGPTAASGDIRQVAVSGQNAPEVAASTLFSFNSPVINEEGRLAFFSLLNSSSDGAGVFVQREIGSSLQLGKFVAEGDVIPELANQQVVDLNPAFSWNTGLGSSPASCEGNHSACLGRFVIAAEIGAPGSANNTVLSSAEAERMNGRWLLTSQWSQPDTGDQQDQSPWLQGQRHAGLYGLHKSSPDPSIFQTLAFADSSGLRTVGLSGFDEEVLPRTTEPRNFGERPYYTGFEHKAMRVNDRGDLILGATTTATDASLSLFMAGPYSGRWIDEAPNNEDFDFNFLDHAAYIETDVPETFSLSNDHVAYFKVINNVRRMVRVNIRNPEGAQVGSVSPPGIAAEEEVTAVGDTVEGGDALQDISDWSRVDEDGRVLFLGKIGNLFTDALIRTQTNPTSTPEVLVSAGDAAPGGGNYQAASWDDGDLVHMNEEGQVLFEAFLTGPSARGLFLTDGQETVEVVRTQNPLDGKTTSGFALQSGDDPGGRQAFNNHGQAAFKASFTDGSEGVYLYTPQLHWRAGGDGNWDDRANWTVGIAPAHVHPVVIDQHRVLGPSSATTVHSLTIGGGTGPAQLSLQNSGPLTVSEGLTLEANGTLAGDGTIASDVEVKVGGSISPGTSVGAITVNGDYVQMGTLMIELESLASFDTLTVTGDAVLSGRLEVDLLGGSALNVNDMFPILSAANLTGNFSELVLPTVGNLLKWDVQLSETAVTLKVISQSLLGDANNDGQVTGQDIITVQQNFGKTGTSDGSLPGDANDDGKVTGQDIITVQQNFGKQLAAVTAPVPEPHALALLAALGMGTARRRRRACDR